MNSISFPHTFYVFFMAVDCSPVRKLLFFLMLVYFLSSAFFKVFTYLEYYIEYKYYKVIYLIFILFEFLRNFVGFVNLNQ